MYSDFTSVKLRCLETLSKIKVC